MHVPSSHQSKRESDLLARAKQWPFHNDWGELNADTLQGIVQQEGIDFATSLLYVRLRRSPNHGPIIQDVERRATRSNGEKQETGVKVLIVPGGCHEENSDSRECLRLVHQEVTRLGFEAEIVPTASFGSLADNAQIIQSSLRSRLDLPVVVVSLSKGTAEVKWALRDDPALFQQIAGWINVSGLLYGSEWISWLLDRGISRLGARIWCWYLGYPFSTLEELRRGAGTPLDFDLNLPEQITLMHIVGFPLAGHLSHPYTRRSFQRLSNRGPNDGMGIMLSDLQRAGGVVFPVWNADHFLRPGDKDMRAFVGPVLEYVATRAKRSTGSSKNSVADQQ
jgi:hypothetical protein